MATAKRYRFLPLFHLIRSRNRRFEIYLIAVNVKDDVQKRALLLYQAGEATQEIFDEYFTPWVKTWVMRYSSPAKLSKTMTRQLTNFQHDFAN